MAAAGYPNWSDLNSELLVSIAATDGVSMRDYKSLRAVCTAWRFALVPLSYPCLLSLAESDDSHSVSVFSVPTRRSFHLHTGSSVVVVHSQSSFHGRVRVVGSGNGRFAIAVDKEPRITSSNPSSFVSCTTCRIFLVDPRAGKEVQLVPRTGGQESVRKIVFTPNPNLSPPSHNDDWTAVALYGCCNRVAYIDTGGSSSTEDKTWTTIDVAEGSSYDDMAFHAGDDKVYFLDSSGGVDVLRMPRGGQPAVIEPFTTLMQDPNPTAAYAPPYDVVSTKMVTKHIFFHHGSLYQVWKNTNANVTLGSGYFRMSAHEIFVLRCDPQRWPCWDAVKDLGGCSVFLSKSSGPVVVRPAVPEVRADCVYWIDWQGVSMVCDIATGTSKPWVLPCGAGKGDCWYFGHDDMTSIDGEGTN
ncbi:hypothetical protein CFC21_015143 [Triticum aestivum]|uniref:KIB1-4 beta-propeller domain-containing protein n=2 Tax=Triticum aestivum TaxID=4565 RepID=A0A9R1DVN7_WHEAT|nr:hypothetical protein CFC21_015143 [Triticum aestivum]